MEGDSSTDALRNLAPKWTLAGDEQLLNILQGTHQRILTKCQEVNSKLTQMSSALDDASISLQNVNNKFMALSNSQFIESRVYDDDDIAAEVAPVKEVPQPTVESELSMLKRSIAVLESMHEPVTILRDSDTETDSEDEEVSRTILKPRDMYANRPLPYIIGSQQWKNKWHAGLLPEDSDSDSTTSKRQTKESDQYSDSEQEIEENTRTDTTLRVPDRTISETSSELASEQDILPPSASKQTPSDIAAELARRLGGQPPTVTEAEPDVVLPKPNRKVYKPELPVTGRVFLDEPPPLDDNLSESSSDNGDIFAELHKKGPQEKKNRDVNPVEDLFGFNREEEYHGGDIFKDFAKEKVCSQDGTQKSSVFDKDSEPELFVAKGEENHQNVEASETSTSSIKKPVGGISLFGNDKGAENIGAAILRQQRKSSLSSEKTSEVTDERDSLSKNDVFDDLFDKSKMREKAVKKHVSKDDEKIQKNVINEIFDRNKQKDTVKKTEPVNKKELDDILEKTINNNVYKNQNEKLETQTTAKPQIDIFKDDLFDDIDDIFTSNIVKIPKKDDKNTKSLFEDTDDLFAEITAPKSKEPVKTSLKDNKIFKIDDGLFADKPNDMSSNKVVNVKPIVQKVTNEVGSIASESKNVDKSIFDSDDELFSEKPSVSKSVNKTNTLKQAEIESRDMKIKSSAVSKINVDKNIFESHDELFKENTNSSYSKKQEKSTVKDTDVHLNTASSVKDEETKDQYNNNVNEDKKKIENSKNPNNKKSIFDSDSDSDIFLNVKIGKANKSAMESNASEHTPETSVSRDKILDENKNSKDFVRNTNNKISNLKSPSLFGDEDDDNELFGAINDNIKTTNVMSITDNTVKMRTDYAAIDLENHLSHNTKTAEDNDACIAVYKNEGTRKVHTLETNYELPNPVDNTANFTNETQSNNTLEDNNIETDISKPFNTIIVAKETSNKINETNIFKSNTTKGVEDTETNEDIFKVNNMPVIVTHNNTPKESKVVNDEIIDQSENQTSTLFNENDSIISQKNATSDEFEDVFNKPPEFNTTKETPKPDIFSDIFMEPPVFEKQKQPKKSKNINALFDDDSDDEALFLRKSDVVDDVPRDITPIVKKDIFGIFHDEPPAVDVDSTTKSNQYSNISHGTSSFDDDSKITEVTLAKTEIKIHSSASDICKSTEDRKQITETENSKDTRSRRSSSNDINIFKNDVKKSINIHDLFTKEVNISQDIETSHPNDNNEEYLKENFKPIDHEKLASVTIVNEQQKGKNSSLFDDQSDDELFKSPSNDIKKNVKTVQEDEIDNLFRSRNKISKIDTNKSFDDLFKSTENEILIKETKIFNDYSNLDKSNDLDIAINNKNTTKPVLIKESNITTISQADNSNSSDTQEESKSEAEISIPNKIGKLKARINIDVSKLLPGASPKKKINKPKSPEQEVSTPISVPTPLVNKDVTKEDNETNEQNINIQVTIDTNRDSSISLKTDNTDQKTAKSIKFDEQGSTILDNTISKERAKIQVKRRPSTRRARREAVRKSIIDNDSTDNSSSIDDQPKSLEIDLSLDLNKQENLLQDDVDTEKTINVEDNSQIKIEPKENNTTIKDPEISKHIVRDESKVITPVEDKTEPDIIQKVEINEEMKVTPTKMKALEINKQISIDKSTDMGNTNKPVTSKIVYVLNDEDIFNTQTEPSAEKHESKLDNYVKSESIIFQVDKPPPVSQLIKKDSKDNINPIPTLGNVYKDKTSDNIRNITRSKALFDELSDEDKLFGKGKNRKIFSTKALFDSDSDDDLFVGSKEKKETKHVVKKRESILPLPKGSLFGDDDDDDDLFGDKRKKAEKLQPPRPSTSREASKSSETVFQDPLSMLGSDD